MRRNGGSSWKRPGSAADVFDWMVPVALLWSVGLGHVRPEWVGCRELLEISRTVECPFPSPSKK